MDDFPISAHNWMHGLSLEAFVDGMQHHQDATRRRLAQVALLPADCAALARLSDIAHMLVMTEDWCGDSLLTVPILAHMAAAAPAMDLRLFPRSLSPQLDAYYEVRGITHIPVVTFLDTAFRPRATWVERPQLAHDRLDAWNAAHPAVAAVRSDASLDPNARRQALRLLTAGLLDEMESWYNTGGLQQALVDEIKQLLQIDKL